MPSWVACMNSGWQEWQHSLRGFPSNWQAPQSKSGLSCSPSQFRGHHSHCGGCNMFALRCVPSRENHILPCRGFRMKGVLRSFGHGWVLVAGVWTERMPCWLQLCLCSGSCLRSSLQVVFPLMCSIINFESPWTIAWPRGEDREGR